MEFRILGPLEVRDAGTVLALGGPRHRKLLAMLLVHAGELLSTERLIEALWGQAPPPSAASMLYVRMSELRRLLAAGRPDRTEVLCTRSPGYLLQVGPDELDARRFERLATAGRLALAGGDPETAAERLREGLALWRGSPLADVADEPFAQPEIDRLEGLRLQALEDRIEADLARGGHAEVAGELERLVADHPLRERLWGQLMLARYRAGRQGEALQSYQDARGMLVAELGIEPGVELQRLQSAILRQDPALMPRAPVTGRRDPEAPNNLPARLTSLIGREAEVAEVGKLLVANPLVTLTGAGGVGKSRLALEVAARRPGDHPDGVWLVELAALTEPGLVAQTVATVVGVREHPERPLVDLLAEHLRADEVLLVLDNCEHLIAGVADLVKRLLSACPKLRILTTSRQRLGITGEVLRPVSGLDLAEPGVTSAAVVGDAAAVRLFVERAAAVQPGFALSDATARAVAQICRRLDGLPLAIELAAARLSALGVEQVAARIDDRFGLLTHGDRGAIPRHQTLRAVVAWSYGLLDEPERRLFDRLAVFAGGFTLEAAETVCAEPDDEAVVELLTRLVDKSLVSVETGGAPTHRYRLLETLRAYGLERLGRRDPPGALHARHAAFYLALAEAARDAIRGPEQATWLERVGVEHGNLRAALAWSLREGRAETAVRLASSLYRFWDIRGHYTEGRRWLSMALAMPGPVLAEARARALVDEAQLAVLQGDVGHGVAGCELAAALCREAGDAPGLARALQYLGFVATFTGDLDRALPLLEESLQLARAGGGGTYLEGWSLLVLAIVAVARGEHDRATELAEEGELLLRRVGDLEGVAWTLLLQGAAALQRGDGCRALAPLRAGIQAFQDLGSPWGLSLCVLVTAQLTRASGRWRRTASLLGAAEALRESVGAAMIPFVQTWRELATAEATAALGAERFERDWEAGHALPPAAAVDEAMRALDAASSR